MPKCRKFGVARLQEGSKKYGITAGLLMCFMTELGPQGAEECLEQVTNQHTCNWLHAVQPLCKLTLAHVRLP